MIKEKTLSQKIADQLAEEIVLGRILPGTRMDEQSLATRFDVSRSPVRDALRQLAVTRLVEYKPRCGFSAAAINPSELDALFEASGEVEALCAKLCALRAAPAERKRIQHLHEAAVKAAAEGDTKTYSQMNDDLHGLIYAGSHNHVLEEMALSLRQRLAPFRAQVFFLADNRIKSSSNEHEDLVQALLCQDGAAAAHAMYEHSSNSAMNVLQHLNDA